MFLERRAEAIRLPDGDRAVSLRDDQAKPAVADSSQGVDPAGLGPDHAHELAQDSPEPRFAIFAA